MIYYSPYTTTLGKAFNVKDITQDITKFAIFSNSNDENYNWIKEDKNNYVITIYPNNHIDKFDHPLTLSEVKGYTTVAVDLSPFTRIDLNGNITVANKALYSLQVMRAYLTANLCNEGARGIKSLSSNLIRTYNDLITNSLAMAFSLNGEEIIALKSLSSWMYFSMLSEQEEVGDLELNAVIAKIARDTNIPGSFLMRYIDGKVVKSVEEFIELIKAKIPNAALQKLNLGLFYTVVAKNLNSSVWIGLEKQQILAISLEHIPTFVSVVVMALTEPVFKNAGLAKMALKNFSKDKTQFVLGVQSIVNSSI